MLLSILLLPFFSVCLILRTITTATTAAIRGGRPWLRLSAAPLLPPAPRRHPSTIGLHPRREPQHTPLQWGKLGGVRPQIISLGNRELLAARYKFPKLWTAPNCRF